MRDMRPDPDQGFPSQYTCSDCAWSFPLEHLSELADFFQQRTAILSFSSHTCASFPFIPKDTSRRPEDYSHAEDLPKNRATVSGVRSCFGLVVGPSRSARHFSSGQSGRLLFQ